MNKTRIVCYGDSNTWGYCAATGQRYEDDERWTQRLQALLGDGFQVVEEGLCSRTTVFEDPLNEGVCGLAPLTAILRSHAPVDVLMLMLGTNDCKQRFGATAQNIADGMKRVILKARALDVWRDAPRILLAAPIIIDPRVAGVPRVGQEMGALCVEKSRQLPGLYRQLARDTGCFFLDSNPFVHTGEDFMHFNGASQAPFARAVAQTIREEIL